MRRDSPRGGLTFGVSAGIVAALAASYYMGSSLAEANIGAIPRWL